MVDLAKLVHEQHEIVDSIEEQVERTAHDVEQSNKHLKQAVRTNQAKYPVVAAAAGSVIVGGLSFFMYLIVL
jgi:t-SNARE complex subunit (syntaxin)